jgi:LPXTG-motif cell wall-anchored protein
MLNIISILYVFLLKWEKFHKSMSVVLGPSRDTMGSLGGDKMTDSLMPPGRTGGNKTIIFLIVGGLALSAAAGIFLFRESANPPPDVPTKSEDAPIPVKTLVAPLPPPSNAQAAPEAEKDKDTSASTQPSVIKESKKSEVEGGSGTIDTKAVNAYFNSHFDQVRACYERRLKINSLLQGKLDLNIVVSTSGKVSSIGVNSDTVRDAEMLSCVKKTIRTWELPKPEGGRVVIGKTFSFKKKE